MIQIKTIVKISILILGLVGVILFVQQQNSIGQNLFKKNSHVRQHSEHDGLWDYDGCKPSVKGQFAQQCQERGGAVCKGNSHGYHECCEGALGLPLGDYCESYMWGRYHQCKKAYPYINHDEFPCPTDPCKEPCDPATCTSAHTTGRADDCWSGNDVETPFVCDTPRWCDNLNKCRQKTTGTHDQRGTCLYKNWNVETQSKCIESD